jgi:hypothetical protein
MDSIPIGILFTAVVIIMAGAIELGFRAGNTHPEQAKKDKEKITSHNATAILGLLGFILVFTFGIVYSRYDSKKGLVREEANLIRTVFLRSDFLDVQDQRETVSLLKKYVDLRLEAANFQEVEKIQALVKESGAIQRKIWDMTVANPKKNMDSHFGALYIESLNEMINQQYLRIAVGLNARIPTVVLVMLFSLVVLGMFSVGYQVSIAGSSRRSWLTPVMILCFSLMITLIASLDRPNSTALPVTQQPLIDVRAYMDEMPKVPLTP